MSDLSERLHGIDRLDAPDLMAGAYRRAQQGGGAGRDPGRNGRAMTIAVAAIIGLGSVAVAAWAFGRAEGQTTPAASQQTIIYTSVPFPDTPAQLYSMRPDGSDVTQLTHDTASYFDAALSPNGSQLAFVRLDTDGKSNEGIYVGDPDGSNATEIFTSTETPQSIMDLQWSPDGQALAFVLRSIPPGGGSEADFTQRLWVLGTDGSGLHLVSHDQITSFSWDPSGNGFAVTKEFVSGGHFIDAIFKIALDGTTTEQLTSQGDAHDPVWSPNGQQITYQAGWADAVHLMVMDADGSHAHAVPLQWDGWSDPLTWSPDSQDVLVAAGNDQHECATLLVDATSGASAVLLDGTTMLAAGDVAPGETPEMPHATGDPCIQSASWSGGSAATDSAPTASPSMQTTTSPDPSKGGSAEGDTSPSASDPAANSSNYLFSDFEVNSATDPRSGNVIAGTAEVKLTQRWSTDEFPGEHRCSLTVLDANGREIGTSDFQLMNMPSSRRSPMPVDVNGSIDGATASGSCDPARLDAPVGYSTSVTAFTPTDRGIEIGYQVTQPPVVPPWEQISEQSCTAAAWDDAGVLSSAHFTLSVPDGLYRTGIDMNPNDVPRVTKATVTCAPFAQQRSFPDPAAG